MRIFAGVLVAFLLVMQRPAQAEPLLWAVTDADSTVYLFGTIHALPATAEWRSEKIDQAFSLSEDLWLEVILDPAEMQRLVAKYGFDHKTPLARKLSILERRQLGAALRTVQIPWASVQSFRPWFAALTLVSATIHQAGFDPESGADRQFESAAENTGKPIHALETLEQQLGIFGSLDATAELEMLRQALAEFEEGPDFLRELARSWIDGDAAKLEEAVVAGIQSQSADLYQSIFVKRNANWVVQIDQMMKGAGTHFIAVGAGHLVGADSVPAMLTARGFTVTQQ